MAPSRDYKPNRVSRSERAFNLVLAVVLLAYGVTGLVTHSIRINNRNSLIAHLEGGPAWLMAAALLLGASVFASVVVDHYDTRDNERYYRAFRWVATRLGWALVAAALLAHLYIGFAR
jgi:hypothetical protein